MPREHARDACQRHRSRYRDRRARTCPVGVVRSIPQPRGRERAVGFAAINGFRAAEESAVEAEQVSQVRIHASNLEGVSTLGGTTSGEICGYLRHFLEPERLG